MLGLGLGIPLGSYIKSAISPTAISAANLALWYQFNTGQTLDGLNTIVRKWDDQSGNNNHASNSSDTNCAAIDSGALDFEESQDDFYNLAQTVTVPQNGGFCLAVVLEQETNSANTILSKASSSNDFIAIHDAPTFKFKASTGSVVETEFVFDPSPFVTSEKMLIVLTRTAGSSNRFKFYKNSSLLTPDTDNSTNEAQGENPNGFAFNVFGSKNPSSGSYTDMFDGKIYDLAFWDDELSTAEISNVIDYFTSTHGL
tara:strand:+ start:392 stop:1159 length:768 start_codon:yes stop_codon:yes gene_type:complete